MPTIERKIILFLVTGAGAGYCPRFPGTVGTIVAIPLSLGLNRLATVSLPLALLVLAGGIACAILLSTKAAEILGQKDPAIIIIDEIAGFLLANFVSPPGVVALGSAFVLFRIFDIGKVYPASKLQMLPGGSGIVLDDIMAGLYTFLILRVFSSLGVL